MYPTVLVLISCLWVQLVSFIVFYNDKTQDDYKLMNSYTFFFFILQVFNSDLSEWSVTKATTLEEMFTGAKVFNSDLSKWKVDNCLNFGKSK